MHEDPSYRNRVATVRGRARAQLAAIRKERLQRKRGKTDATCLTSDHPEFADQYMAPRTSVSTSDHIHDPDVSLSVSDDIGTGPGMATAEDEGETPQTLSRGDIGVAQSMDDLETVQVPEPDATAPRMDDVPKDGGQMIAIERAVDFPPSDSGTMDLRRTEASDICSTQAVLPAVTGTSQDEPAVSDAESIASPAALFGIDTCETEPTDAVRSPVPGTAPGSAGPALATTFPSPESGAARSDLFEIPGIGSGLVWIFQSVGIETLDDLARAQSRDLSERLGSIARLLDVDYFVNFARNRDFG